MIWHILFGIERSTEALLNPTHLLLAFSGVLIVSGPLRAAWRRASTSENAGWRMLFPMLLSFLATYSFFTFFTEYASPFVHPWLVTQVSDDLQIHEPEEIIASSLLCFLDSNTPTSYATTNKYIHPRENVHVTAYRRNKPAYPRRAAKKDSR